MLRQGLEAVGALLVPYDPHVRRGSAGRRRACRALARLRPSCDVPLRAVPRLDQCPILVVAVRGVRRPPRPDRRWRQRRRTSCSSVRRWASAPSSCCRSSARPGSAWRPGCSPGVGQVVTHRPHVVRGRGGHRRRGCYPTCPATGLLHGPSARGLSAFQWWSTPARSASGSGSGQSRWGERLVAIGGRRSRRTGGHRLRHSPCHR